MVKKMIKIMETNETLQSVRYEISPEAYTLIGKISKETGLRKSSVVDNLVKLYGMKFISAHTIAVKKANQFFFEYDEGKEAI